MSGQNPMRDMLGHDVPALVLTGDISTKTLSEIARQVRRYPS